jgi:hypothetical protein
MRGRYFWWWKLLSGLERLSRAIGRYLHDFRYAQEKKCVEEYVIKTREDVYTQTLSTYPHNVSHCESWAMGEEKTCRPYSHFSGRDCKARRGHGLLWWKIFNPCSKAYAAFRNIWEKKCGKVYRIEPSKGLYFHHVQFVSNHTWNLLYVKFERQTADMIMTDDDH